MDACRNREACDTGTLPFDYGLCTHIGKRRTNQDAALVPSAPGMLSDSEWLFAIADGMGGHPGGGFASRMACDHLLDFYEKNVRNTFGQLPVDIGRRAVEAVIRTDRAIRLQGRGNSTLEDMGTTLSCLILARTHSIIVHVGDSRIYRLRNGSLSCLTVDHTFVQDMISEGEIDPQQAHRHPLRHMLTRAVGTGEPLDRVDSRVDRLKAKDCFLLCTDGLTGTITEKDILDALDRRSSATRTAEELVESALENGARDNITAVVVKL